jgi:hypothetical protein
MGNSPVSEEGEITSGLQLQYILSWQFAKDTAWKWPAQKKLRI